MTGNNKVWRASLAGLASVAMLATMGVVAGTANAATTSVNWPSKSVKVDGGNTAQVEYGDSLADYAAKDPSFAFTVNAKPGQKFIGFEGDVSVAAPVTTDTTLKPVFVEDSRAVPVEVTYGGYSWHFDENGAVTATASDAPYKFYAESNKALSNQFKPVDVPNDGYVATSWNFTGTAQDGKLVDLGTHSDFSEVNAQNYTKITAKPADATTTAKTVTFDYTAYAKDDKGNDLAKLAGAVADSDNPFLPAVVDYKLKVDAPKDTEVIAPTLVVNPDLDQFKVPGSWRNTADDKLVVNAGDKVTVSDDDAKNVYKADNATESVVVTYTDGVGDPGQRDRPRDGQAGQEGRDQHVRLRERHRQAADPRRLRVRRLEGEGHQSGDQHHSPGRRSGQLPDSQLRDPGRPVGADLGHRRHVP